MGGLVVGALGVDAVRHVDRRPGHIAIAALPFVLGAHQVVEAFVWWGEQGHAPASLGRTALWIYLLIAFVVLPVYVPLAVFTLERAGPRRWELAPFVAMGAFVAVALLLPMVTGTIGANVQPYRLHYWVDPNPGIAITVLYVTAVCGALLLSGHKILVLFGAANLAVLPGILLLDADGFASLWCAYAALVAGVIALYMRLGRRDPAPRLAAVA